MLSPGFIESLRQLPPPVLTVYLDTNRERQENRALRPRYLTWFKSEAQRIAPALPPDERALFQEQAERVEAYLAHEAPRHRGIVILAGPAAWEAVPVEIEVENELRWGAPALAQLLWLLDEHPPRGVTVVWQKGARLFRFWMGEMLELEEKEFRLEESKKKEMGPISRPGVRMSRGTDRDLYEHHVAAQYAHFHRQIAERIQHWAAIESLKTVFLVGLPENVAGIQEELPQALRERVVLVREDLGGVGTPELLQRLRPLMVSQERESELALVHALLGSDRSVVTGVDETLARLQHGDVRSLIVVKGLNGNLHQCRQCQWIDRTSDPVCPICGGERCAVTLRQIVPELARRHQVPTEVVSGEAARRLQEAGGMAARLREFERKEYG
jgi:Bacterial archaeo-eukaryotic release factor family 10